LSDASAKPTALHKDVHAEGITYRAQNSACAAKNCTIDEDCNIGNGDSDDDEDGV